MPRVPRKPEASRSEYWMRVVANKHSEPFARRFREASGVDGEIRWRSPVSDDEYSEYYDEDFLERIGCESLSDELKAFWPASGPRWDGLATTSTGQVIIVEAKAHLDEVITDCEAGEDSFTRIADTFTKMKLRLKIPKSRLRVSWASPYYQFCNRVAHLAFLRDQGIDAHLVFLAFADAPDVPRPVSEDRWMENARHIRHATALHAHALIKFDHDIVIPVSEIQIANGGEKDGADQPATAPESKPEGEENPKPESELHPQ